MTQFLPLTAGGLTYVLAYDPSGTPPPENQKPSFTSTPVETATQNEAYEYTAVATDPEGDTITYSLDTYPTGMTIGETTGVVDWTPTEAATESVVIRATDEHGAYETQSFSVVVAEGTNDPPAFTSTAVTTATEGGLYAYTAVAEDPEDDEITYSLDTYPTGMTIGTYTGIIHWVPTSTDTEAVVVRATDSNGAYTTQSFDIVVGSFAAAGGVDIDAAWLADADNGGPSGPYYLGTKNKIYRLQTDVTTDGTAFAIINSGITFNLNGHTITYDNATPIVVTNGSFEAGTGGTATGWDFTHGAHCLRTEGVYLSNTVYDGDYALKCSGYEGDEYVESTATVTLEANTTYSLSAMLYHVNVATGASVYVKLINQGDGADVTASQTVTLWRGIQLTEGVFTTDATNLTYKVQAGAVIPSGASTYAAYIDDIKIQRTRAYGVTVSAYSWAPTYYKDVTQYGRATGATVVNGTITQGADKGTWCHGVFSYESGGTIRPSSLTITVAGANSSGIYGLSDAMHVVRNVITSNVQTITARDMFDGTVVYGVNKGVVCHNTIANGPHAGIVCISSIADSNTIQLVTKYTNAFAIRASGSSDVKHNTIACGTGDYAARGILATNNSTGVTAYVRHNTVTVQGTIDNQEQGTAVATEYACYGIQVENCSDLEVYDNTVTAIGDATQAAAFRMNVDGADHGSGVVVRDNVFIGTRTAANRAAACLMFTNVLGSEVSLSGNDLQTNNRFVYKSSDCSDVVLTGSTVKVSGDTTGFRAIESYDWNFDGNNIIHDLKFVDNSYYDETTEGLLVDAPVTNSNGNVDPYSSFIHSFTTTILVKNAGGTPVAGATVVITDTDDTEVYSGTTGAAGTVAVVLDEFRTLGDVKTSYSPYTAAVTSGELAGSEEFTADATQTITVVVA